MLIGASLVVVVVIIEVVSDFGVCGGTRRGSGIEGGRGGGGDGAARGARVRAGAEDTTCVRRRRDGGDIYRRGLRSIGSVSSFRPAKSSHCNTRSEMELPRREKVDGSIRPGDDGSSQLSSLVLDSVLVGRVYFFFSARRRCVGTFCSRANLTRQHDSSESGSREWTGTVTGWSTTDDDHLRPLGGVRTY